LHIKKVYNKQEIIFVEANILSDKKNFSLYTLNKIEDLKNISDLAKKHVAVIESPQKVEMKKPFKVRIKVGGVDGIEHPNTLAHWIVWVQLFAGERLVSRFDFGPELCDGYLVEIYLSLSETTYLRAQGFCNLHGVWEGIGKKVTVT
jgi:superoxide reductase